MKIKIVFLPDWLKNFYLRLIFPVINFFIKRNLNPNHFTTLGLVISIISAYFFAIGKLWLAGVLMLLAGTFDIIDGKVARATNRVTKFGALYDSTLDRYAEVMIFFGLAYYFVHSNWTSGNFEVSVLGAVAVCIALGGAVMTSYVRARAEGLGLECKVGVMQRPERIVLIAFGAIFHKVALLVALLIVAIFANVTAIQRLYHIWRTERQKGNAAIATPSR
ncbi:MAG: CDP-alcohol phosphatidyltransferase family protein [candidate division KSB1 bacterium]|nr:CDP-alcohol phosphatidyltransferase family protein [candidate division KSB1 bacterium]